MESYEQFNFSLSLLKLNHHHMKEKALKYIRKFEIDFSVLLWNTGTKIMSCLNLP